MMLAISISVRFYGASALRRLLLPVFKPDFTGRKPACIISGNMSVLRRLLLLLLIALAVACVFNGIFYLFFSYLRLF
jgi:hypothetical protein